MCVRKIINYLFLNKKNFIIAIIFKCTSLPNSHFHIIRATDLIIKPRDNDNRSQMEIDSILNLAFPI